MPVGLALQPFELEPRRLVRRRVEEGARRQPHQAAVAGLARGQQHDALARRRRHWRCGRRGRCRRNRCASAQPTIGWMPARAQLFGEFQRAEHVVGVGERQRRLLVGFGELGQARDV